MHALMILLIYLAVAVLPIFHIRKLLKENNRQSINEMDKKQKRGYYFALSGAIFIGVLVFISLTLLILLVIQIIKMGPEGAGYLFAFIVIPGAIAVVIGGVTAYVPLMYCIPTIYLKKQRLASILFIIMGMISFFIVPMFLFLLFIGIDFLVLDSESDDGLVNLLDADTFHPLMVLMYTIFIGPLLLIVGGILSFLNDRQQKRGIEK